MGHCDRWSATLVTVTEEVQLRVTGADEMPLRVTGVDVVPLRVTGPI